MRIKTRKHNIIENIHPFSQPEPPALTNKYGEPSSEAQTADVKNFPATGGGCKTGSGDRVEDPAPNAQAQDINAEWYPVNGTSSADWQNNSKNEIMPRNLEPFMGTREYYK